MILTCNSCGKNFVVPDNAITPSGRMVQCGSCGNKWKQFPKNEINENKLVSSSKKIASKPRPTKLKSQVVRKSKKTNVKKTREISLYSPEYLAKKHGIKLNETQTKKSIGKTGKEKVSFGFYNSLIIFIFLAVSISRILYFSQGFIISYFPGTEYYLEYFFESIRNIFEIWKNLVTNY